MTPSRRVSLYLEYLLDELDAADGDAVDVRIEAMQHLNCPDY